MSDLEKIKETLKVLGTAQPSIDLDKPVKGCGERTYEAILSGAVVGSFLGAIQIAWYPDPITSVKGEALKTDLAALARKGFRPAVWMAAVGATFAFSECACEGLRNKRDPWNASFGGMVAGVVLGSITRRFDIMTSCAIGCGLGMGVADAFGATANYNRSHGVAENKGALMPLKHEESADLKALKEKYTKFENN